jgi:hypothetical protein
MGARESLLAKLDAISHAPEEGCQAMRAGVAAGKLPGLEQTVGYPMRRLPEFVLKHPHRFPFQP